MAKEKIRTKIKIKHQGPYEKKRVEVRTKNGKTEAAGRVVDIKDKKVYEMYKSPKDKVYKLKEELGAVQRRGVDLSPSKKPKIKLLPEKANRNKKRNISYKVQ